MTAQAPETRRVVVAGATGYLGGYVVRALHAHGYSVRALTRDEDRLGELRELCDEVFVGQATQPETIAGLCDDCDIAYVGLGIRSARRKPSFWDVDRDANLNVLGQAVAAGVEHIVFVAAHRSDRLAELGVGPARAREAVVDAVVASDRRYTIVRGTGFFNDMTELFEMARKGRGWLIGDGSFQMNPIHGADLADEVVAALTDETCWNTVISRGGPNVLSLRQIYELAFDALGKPVRLSRVPAWLLGPARHLVRPFNPTLAGFIHAIQAGIRLGDAIAPACGTHTLAAYYRELADAV